MAVSVAHELGHLAGLAHNETPAMAAPSEDALPSELDVLRLREFYGSR